MIRAANLTQVTDYYKSNTVSKQNNTEKAKDVQPNAQKIKSSEHTSAFLRKMRPSLTAPEAALYNRSRHETHPLGCFPKKSTQTSQKFLIDRV